MSVMPQQSQGSRQILSAMKASAISGLSHSYITHLARTGQVEAIKPGHDWLVYEDSLLAFLTQPRSPGRPGPRKKRLVRQNEQGERVLLSTAEAHERYGYARDTLSGLLRRGAIEGEKSGRTWLIYEDSLMAYKQRMHPGVTIVESTLVAPLALPAPTPTSAELEPGQPAASSAEPQSEPGPSLSDSGSPELPTELPVAEKSDDQPGEMSNTSASTTTANQPDESDT